MTKEQSRRARQRNRRPIEKDGTIPRCLVCSGEAKKHDGRNRWFATCGNRNCFDQLRFSELRKTKRSAEYAAVARAAAIKAAATQRAMLIDGRTKSSITAEKIKSANSLVGPDGLTGYQRAARKAAPKVRASNVKNKHWAPLHEKTEFDRYRMAVGAAQRRFLQEIKQLPNYEFRGPSGASDSWHLDHRISVWMGFMCGIDPSKIGHICKLQMKPWIDNNRKWKSSDLTLEQLQQMINDYSSYKPSVRKILQSDNRQGLKKKLT